MEIETSGAVSASELFLTANAKQIIVAREVISASAKKSDRWFIAQNLTNKFVKIRVIATRIIKK